MILIDPNAFESMRQWLIVHKGIEVFLLMLLLVVWVRGYLKRRQDRKAILVNIVAPMLARWIEEKVRDYVTLHYAGCREQKGLVLQFELSSVQFTRAQAINERVGEMLAHFSKQWPTLPAISHEFKERKTLQRGDQESNGQRIDKGRYDRIEENEASEKEDQD